MEISLHSVLLSIGLGLLGFVEPCTVGSHLIFLRTQADRQWHAKIKAVVIFTLIRSSVTGAFGALIGFAGRFLVDVQAWLWLLFGVIYLAIGLAFLSRRAGLFKLRLDFAPTAWRRASNPVILGLAFGLNIPACAAPILFGLMTVAAGLGGVDGGFALMFLFGFFLSSPLIVFALMPGAARKLDRLGEKFGRGGRLIGIVFVVLGLWAIWFGIFVDLADWAG